jgi:GNAT superfamily N-acetyltransferase
MAALREKGTAARPPVYALRAARPRDLPTLRAVETAAVRLFAEVGLAKIAEDEPTDPDVLEAARAAGRLWVADREGEAVGFALVELLDGTPHLLELDVAPDHARHGLGTRLVHFVAAWARRRGHDALTLTTFRDVPWNGPFYEKLGFCALDEAALPPGLAARRARERALGIDVAPRVAMRLPLGPP